MSKFKCPCKYTYDPEKGDPKQNIPPGTPFEELPDTWRCPRCKQPKEEPIGHLTALRRMKRFFGLRPQNDKRAPAGL